MARKFTWGMTYQWKVKDLANAWEYLFGVAVIGHGILAGKYLADYPDSLK
jgi:hypothetical protein